MLHDVITCMMSSSKTKYRRPDGSNNVIPWPACGMVDIYWWMHRMYWTSKWKSSQSVDQILYLKSKMTITKLFSASNAARIPQGEAFWNYTFKDAQSFYIHFNIIWTLTLRNCKYLWKSFTQWWRIMILKVVLLRCTTFTPMLYSRRKSAAEQTRK